ncbi:MAG: 1-deoxy-D-xylulose-5-phosphate synthase [Verrucomicrobia bacterium]|nr:1-deoxy-D-xylulose-5-phosphate synthase [Verrucomicrobiota bacterium]
MRRAFAETLSELATSDPRIVLLTADLGFMALEPFADAHPKRFFNVGVAEQNMVGVATGMAEAGFIPFVYSIVNFATMRPFEFIRNGPIAHNLPVRIVSVGGGFEYGHNGVSHFGLEDIGVMRTQPNMTIVTPCDAEQARAAIRATWDCPGPMYLRLGKDDRMVVPGLEGQFALGRADVVHKGDDVLLIAAGTAAIESLNAAHALKLRGIGATVLAVSSLNPAPRADLVTALARFKIALTVETHYITGGLGSLVCEVVAEEGIVCKVIRCGVKNHPGGVTGSQAYLHRVHGISSERLVTAAVEAIKSLHE